MQLVRAIIRPEKKDEVLFELSKAGYHAVTILDVVGRGKQKGIRIGSVIYDEIPKIMLMMAIRDEDKENLVSIILQTAKTGASGAFGDGKIFIGPIDQAYTVSTGKADL